MKYHHKNQFKEEKGYLMISVLGLLTVAMILGANISTSTNNSVKASKTIGLVNERYYEVEAAISEVVNWMQDNSTDLGNYFDKAYFEANFETRTSEDLIGENEVANFGVPSRLKVAGSGNNTAMISNNSEFGSSVFPTIGSFDPVESFETAFPNSDNGGVNMRLSLIWAENLGEDIYSPVFRIDAITGNNPDRGIHLYSNIVGRTTIITPAGNGGVPGAYEIDPENDYTNYYNNNSANTVSFIGASNCNSKPWSFNGTSWSGGATQSACYLASRGTVNLSGAGTKIFGAVYSSLAFSSAAKVTSYEGLPNGLNSTCRTGNCTNVINPLIEFDQDLDGDVDSVDYPWSYFCSSSTNATQSGGVLDLAAGCYDTVTVTNGAILNLTSLRTIDDTLDGFGGGVSKLDLKRSRTPYNNNTSTGYYIRNLNINSNAIITVDRNNRNAVKNFADVYVENLSDVAGKSTINAGNAPYKLRLSVMDSFRITSNNADVNAHIIVPRGTIDLAGGRNYHGNIQAHNFTITGNANLFGDGVLTANYSVNELTEDTAAGAVTPPVYGISFDSYKISQKFR